LIELIDCQGFFGCDGEVYDLGWDVGEVVDGFTVVDEDGGGDVILEGEGIDNIEAGLDLAGGVDVGVGDAVDEAFAGFFDAAVDEGIEHAEPDEAEAAVDPGFDEGTMGSAIGFDGEFDPFEFADLRSQGLFLGQELMQPLVAAFDNLAVAELLLQFIDFGLEAGFLLQDLRRIGFGDVADEGFEFADPGLGFGIARDGFGSRSEVGGRGFEEGQFIHAGLTG